MRATSRPAASSIHASVSTWSATTQGASVVPHPASVRDEGDSEGEEDADGEGDPDDCDGDSEEIEDVGEELDEGPLLGDGSGGDGDGVTSPSASDQPADSEDDTED